MCILCTVCIHCFISLKWWTINNSLERIGSTGDPRTGIRSNQDNTIEFTIVSENKRQTASWCQITFKDERLLYVQIKVMELEIESCFLSFMGAIKFRLSQACVIWKYGHICYNGLKSDLNSVYPWFNPYTPENEFRNLSTKSTSITYFAYENSERILIQCFSFSRYR